MFRKLLRKSGLKFEGGPDHQRDSMKTLKRVSLNIEEIILFKGTRNINLNCIVVVMHFNNTDKEDAFVDFTSRMYRDDRINLYPSMSAYNLKMASSSTAKYKT